MEKVLRWDQYNSTVLRFLAVAGGKKDSGRCVYSSYSTWYRIRTNLNYKQ